MKQRHIEANKRLTYHKSDHSRHSQLTEIKISIRIIKYSIDLQNMFLNNNFTMVKHLIKCLHQYRQFKQSPSNLMKLLAHVDPLLRTLIKKITKNRSAKHQVSKNEQQGKRFIHKLQKQIICSLINLYYFKRTYFMRQFSDILFTYKNTIHEMKEKDSNLQTLLEILFYASSNFFEVKGQNDTIFVELLIHLHLFDYYVSGVSSRLERMNQSELRVQVQDQVELMKKSLFNSCCWLENFFIRYDDKQKDKWTRLIIPKLIAMFDMNQQAIRQSYRQKQHQPILNASNLHRTRFQSSQQRKKIVQAQKYSQQQYINQNSSHKYSLRVIKQRPKKEIYTQRYHSKKQWNQFGLSDKVSQYLLQNAYYFQQYLSQHKSKVILKHYFFKQKAIFQESKLKQFTVATDLAEVVSHQSIQSGGHQQKIQFLSFLIETAKQLILNGMLHKDIKLHNILNLKGQYKLIDFDFVFYVRYAYTEIEKSLQNITKQIMKQWLIAQQKDLGQFIIEKEQLLLHIQDSIINKLFFSRITTVKDPMFDIIQKNLKGQLFKVKGSGTFHVSNKIDKCMSILKEYLPFSIVHSIQNLCYVFHKNFPDQQKRFNEGFDRIKQKLIETYQQQGSYSARKIEIIFDQFIQNYVKPQQ